MGYRLSREVEDHAPASLTWRELCVLGILANAAWDTGERARQIPHIEGNKELIHRLRLPNRSTRFEVIQALVDKGALIRQERGRHGTAAAYRLAVLTPLEGPGSPDATAPSKGPGFPVEGSGFHLRRVRVRRTP
jgi:hypothetical protein